MAITILTVGKTRRGFINDGVSEFLKRLNKYTIVKIIELPDQALKNKNESYVKDQEAETILKRVHDRDYFVLLDSRGMQLTSLEFADFLQKKTHMDLVFCIGGVYGVSDRVKQRADQIISFSKMTFTHQMIRLMLIEQIYRAMNILHGGKYHK